MERKRVAVALLRLARQLVAGQWEKVGPAKERGKFIWKNKDTGEQRVQISEPAAAPAKAPGKQEAPGEDISVGGKEVNWGNLALKRSDLYDGAVKEMEDAFGDSWRESAPDDARKAWGEYNQVLDEIKALGKEAPDGDKRFKPLATKLNNVVSKLRSSIQKAKVKEKLKEKAEGGPSYAKVPVNKKSLAKVRSIMNTHGLKDDSDEVEELAGFKSTLGQRGKGRSEAELKSDFIANMDVANYSSPEAFKKAVDRMKKMPAADFGKILAAITGEDEEEGKTASARVARQLLRLAKQLVAD